MSAVKVFYEVTLQLISLLQKQTIADRDERIQQVEELLDQRGELMEHFKPPYSAEEQEWGSKLIQLEPVLSSLLAKEKLAIQKDLKELSVKKETNHKYVNPYEALSTDGVFYDKRN